MEDEIITVEIDFNKAIVVWSAQKDQRATVFNELLLNKEIRWVPYLFITS